MPFFSLDITTDCVCGSTVWKLLHHYPCYGHSVCLTVIPLKYLLTGSIMFKVLPDQEPKSSFHVVLCQIRLHFRNGSHFENVLSCQSGYSLTKTSKNPTAKIILCTSFSMFNTLSYCLCLFRHWDSYGNVPEISKGELNMIYFKKREIAEKENRRVKKNEEGE